MVTGGIKWFSPTTFKDPHVGTSVELDSWEIPQLKTVYITPYMKVLYNFLEASSQTTHIPGISNILTRRSRSAYILLSLYSLFSLALL